MGDISDWSPARLEAELELDGQHLIEAPAPSSASCCCQNGGEPYELVPGLWVTSRNAGCRVHASAHRIDPTSVRSAVSVRRGPRFSSRQIPGRL
jgi:hypothetical protein